jgi:peptidoglycan/xylan/chitin deacetylase (PgdA/CDA1 family)
VVPTAKSAQVLPLRRVGIGAGIVAVLVAVVVFAVLLRSGGTTRQMVRVTVGGRPVQILAGTTLGAVAARIGARPQAGDLLDVNGKVIRAGAFPGVFIVDGKPATMRRRLFAGDRVAELAGRDRKESLTRSVVLEPRGVPSNPQFFVDRVPGRWLIERGAVSHELVSSRFQPTGPARPQRAVALTFDDGPSPEYTPRILAKLAKLHVPATFFVIGYLSAEYPSLVRREARMGMVVGNHSYNHPEVPPFDELPMPLLRDEISLGDQTLTGLGLHPRLFRPPGGGTAARLVDAAATLGQRVVLWSVDPTDWEPGITPKEIAQRVLAAIRPGSIVDLHDGGGDRSATLAALPAIVHGIRARGLRLVALEPGTGPIAETTAAGR